MVKLLQITPIKIFREEERRNVESSIVVESLVFERIKLYGRDEEWNKIDEIFEARARKQAKENINTIIMPVHCDESHWVLVLIKIEDTEIKVYDSNQCEESKDIEHAMPMLKKYCENSKWINLDKGKEFEIRTDIQCPQQKNSFDCGVYVCYFMYHLYRSSLLQSKIPSDSKAKRRTLKKALLEADLDLLRTA
ncbi:unnamed protein product [Moneuplotes crassus]|uniref:Ubiquitin-like protease family profile domain-containing protein n=1 Tax=Euplotes crassus TaxID=5936 RepID=A0AAD1XUF1_EUPCR|nr:unnamed protein product [Moneuplotes crassus]